MRLYKIYYKYKNYEHESTLEPMTFAEALIVRSKLTGFAIKYKHRSVEIRRVN